MTNTIETNQENVTPTLAAPQTNNTPVGASSPEYPAAESWAYAGIDTTSLVEVTIVGTDEEVPDETANAIQGWLDQSSQPEADRAELIRAAIDLCNGATREFNLAINRFGMSLVERAVLLGKLLIQLKNLVKGFGSEWGTWADEHLPFLAKRNREKYMALARHEAPCLHYRALGVDRLYILCSLARNSHDEEPIGALLTRYHIVQNGGADAHDLSTFKAKVDAAINNERLRKAGINIDDFSLVEEMVTHGREANSAMISLLKKIQSSGGSPETYLNNLAANNWEEESDPSGERRLQDFNTLSSRMIQTIERIAETDRIGDIDSDTLRQLVAKLQDLLRRANLTQDGMEQAA